MGHIIRGLVVAAIFGAWVAFVACEISPTPVTRPPDAAVDAAPEPDADTSPHGYFGRPDSQDVGP